jgi:catechol 2,3-dioxygenase
VAFKIGSKMEELLDAKAKLEAAGLTLSPVDHDVTKSLYFEDPDGNGIEVYIDASDAWRREPQRVAHAEPMTL